MISKRHISALLASSLLLAACGSDSSDETPETPDTNDVSSDPDPDA